MRSVWILWLLVLAAQSCGDSSHAAVQLDVRADAADRFGTFGDFALTERSGRAVTNRDLAGHPWIASFIFTTCAGPCPKVASNVRKLQDELGSSDVRLVTITVDPKTDTPAVLAKYADKYGADANRWWFLTGDETRIYTLIRTSLGLPIERGSGGDSGLQVAHSTRLVVVDPKGAIAGYYSGEELEGAKQALARALWLAGHGG